jgi:hypothetical protein
VILDVNGTEGGESDGVLTGRGYRGRVEDTGNDLQSAQFQDSSHGTTTAPQNWRQRQAGSSLHLQRPAVSASPSLPHSVYRCVNCIVVARIEPIDEPLAFLSSIGNREGVEKIGEIGRRQSSSKARVILVPRSWE